MLFTKTVKRFWVDFKIVKIKGGKTDGYYWVMRYFWFPIRHYDRDFDLMPFPNHSKDYAIFKIQQFLSERTFKRDKTILDVETGTIYFYNAKENKIE